MGRRVAVRGASGAGKTTFATELARRLGVPLVELDALNHGPNWSEPSDEELRTRVGAALDAAPDGWVVDGNYDRKLGDLVVERADTVVWLDMPLALILGRLLRRSARRIHGQVELWNGNRESWRGVLWERDALLPWAVRAHFRHRATYPSRLGAHPGYVRLRSPAAARAWLNAQ